MKQFESDKLLNKLLREYSIRFGWKCSRGFVFKKDRESFFTILVAGIPKTKKLSWSIRFKHYDFDDVFWDIVKLPENKNQPLSFRACGAWVAPSMEIQNGSIVLNEWEEEKISEQIQNIFAELDPLSIEVASSIHSYSSNLEVLENYYTQLMSKYPNAAVTIWVERLLTRLLESNLKEAKKISDARIAEGDEGGFNYAGSSFYQLANEYIETSN